MKENETTRILNLLLASVVSSDNNMTVDAIDTNLAYLDSIKNMVDMRDADELNDEQRAFYDERIRRCEEILRRDRDHFIDGHVKQNT